MIAFQLVPGEEEDEDGCILACVGKRLREEGRLAFQLVLGEEEDEEGCISTCSERKNKNLKTVFTHFT